MFKCLWATRPSPECHYFRQFCNFCAAAWNASKLHRKCYLRCIEAAFEKFPNPKEGDHPVHSKSAMSSWLCSARPFCLSLSQTDNKVLRAIMYICVHWCREPGRSCLSTFSDAVIATVQAYHTWTAAYRYLSNHWLDYCKAAAAYATCLWSPVFVTMATLRENSSVLGALSQAFLRSSIT